MAIPKSAGLSALARLRAEREALDQREVEARRNAAIELGEAVLKAADVALDAAQVGKLISATMKHGFEASMALLSPMAGPRKAGAANGLSSHQTVESTDATG